MEDRLIITAASDAFGPALLCMLGSLDANWPSHPRVIVYDIGLDAATRETLAGARIEVRAVPPFVPHWRRHFTWKIWAWNDAPAHHVLWLDAGLVVLQPMNEVFAATAALGYWAMATYYGLEATVSDAACAACGVPLAFRRDRMTLAGNVIAFDKGGPGGTLVAEALRIAHDESALAATQPLHRHDQALISLLLHKHLAPLVINDGTVYGGWQSPAQTAAQKVWAHRRRIGAIDLHAFAERLGTTGRPYKPSGQPDQVLRPSVKQRYWDARRRLHRLFSSSHQRAWVYDGVRT